MAGDPRRDTADGISAERSLIAEDAGEIPLGAYGAEDWIAFAIFWALAIIVFLQVFTRYVLNSSFAWTEEIARYLLISVTFIGGGIAVRKNSHIHVELLYLLLPKAAGRVLATLVDVLRIGFLIFLLWSGIRIYAVMQTQYMTVVEVPMSVLYGVVLAGIAIMLVRSLILAVRHLRDGGSALEGGVNLSVD
jgi:TRAP-type C4-dicarboxylate transport system permease small subunit